MNAPALELRHISRRFRDVVALAGANLTAQPGTVHALLGENGAGKTTLMRIAYGMLPPDDGELRLHGTPRAFHSPADAIAAGVGMVQQHPTNVAAMSVWENVVLGGHGTLDPARARKEVSDLISQLGFSLDPAARLADLSVAAQQRVEILKAVFRKARVLILDEPTAILAPEEARELYGWLRSFAAGGGTAVVVTHKLEEARRYTDELTVLRTGRTVLQGRSGDITADALTRAMIGEAPPSSRETTPQPTAEVVLRADAISLADDRDVTVIRNASFEVRAGEILGVAGVEGSGHHHLLLAIAGRHSPAVGRLEGTTDASIIPEDRHRDAVVLSFNLLENAVIRMAGSRRGIIPWASLSTRVNEYMRRFDVRAASPSAAMRTLSGGNQQKFVLARELDGDPRLIVAENPTRGLDIRAAAFIHSQLDAARNRGIAVVFYSSDLDEIMELADRVLVVQGGRVMETPKDRNRIGAAMLGAGPAEAA